MRGWVTVSRVQAGEPRSPGRSRRVIEEEPLTTRQAREAGDHGRAIRFGRGLPRCVPGRYGDDRGGPASGEAEEEADRSTSRTQDPRWMLIEVSRPFWSRCAFV
jgi:hypothetical protein